MRDLEKLLRLSTGVRALAIHRCLCEFSKDFELVWKDQPLEEVEASNPEDQRLINDILGEHSASRWNFVRRNADIRSDELWRAVALDVVKHSQVGGVKTFAPLLKAAERLVQNTFANVQLWFDQCLIQTFVRQLFDLRKNEAFWPSLKALVDFIWTLLLTVETCDINVSNTNKFLSQSYTSSLLYS